MKCICQYCGKEFEAGHSGAWCCRSAECLRMRWREYRAYRKAMKALAEGKVIAKKDLGRIAVCRLCGKTFLARHEGKVYCSRRCQTRANNASLPHACDGYRESDTRRINARRREVYARMARFASADGIRK